MATTSIDGPEPDGFAAGAPGALLPGTPLDDDARRILLGLAITAAGIGTFDLDLPTGTLSRDDRLVELFGHDPATSDRTIDSLQAQLHPEDRPRASALLQEAIDTCGSYAAEYRVVLPGGGIRWLAARGRALSDEAGTTVRVLGAAWDITPAREAQDRVAHTLEGLAVGFLALDRNWVMTYVNTEAERITGHPRAQLLGRSLWAAFPATVGTHIEDDVRRTAVTGQPVVFDAHHRLDTWVEVRAVPGPEGVSLYFLDVTARRRTQQESEQSARREQLISRITEELSATLDAAEAVRRLSRLVVPTLGDWSIVTLVDDDQEAGSRRGLRNAGAWHTDPALRETTEAYARSRLTALTDVSMLTTALQTGQPQIMAPDACRQVQAMLAPGPVRALVARLAPDSITVLPLPGRDGPVGILTLGRGVDRGAPTSQDLVTARHVAARSGLVLDGARLYRQQRELAVGLQRALLTAPPEPDHVHVVVRYAPAAQAAEVGGDWYDAFFQPSGATVLVIGDVVGHDTHAAATMGQIRTIVRTIGAQADAGPADVLRQVDKVMETLQVDTAATAIVARLEQTEEEVSRGVTRLRWSNAGHPPPLAIDPDGTVQVLRAAGTDRLLGVTPDVERRETEVTLDRDAVVVLYTDGLVERRDQPLDVGMRRLEETLADLAGRNLDELCDELLARMLPPSPDDDVAIVAVRLFPQDRPRPPEAGPNRIPPNVPEPPEEIVES